MSFAPGDVVRLPDGEPSRKGAKPKKRTATVLEEAWSFPGHTLVEKSDRPGKIWIKTGLCEEIEK